MNLTPELTYSILAIIFAVHLLHHRLRMSHISYVEVLTAAVLCIPGGLALPPALLMTTHLALTAIMVVGSVLIRHLSPACEAHERPGTRFG